MYRHLLGITIPPLAVCRYGCAGCCALPITVFWVGGLAALLYHFIEAPAEHSWLFNGSLLLGIGMILLAIIWTEMAILKNQRQGCGEKSPPGNICRIIPGSQEQDPFEEVRRAKEL